MDRVDTVVIGAGAAGLAAARTLLVRGVDVRVYEAADHAGGVMQSVHEDGFLYELGPNTFRVSGPALALFREIGLEAALVKASPASRKRFLLHQGSLVPVPMDPVTFATSPLLTAKGKLRLFAEPFIRRGDGENESVAAFTTRRLGHEVTEGLISPFLIGVYSGDENQLGAGAVFPSLVEAEQLGGSILVGSLRRRMRGTEAPGAPGSWSASGGMGGLATQMAMPLGEALRLSCAVRSLNRDGDHWRLETNEGEVEARRVVCAVPAPAAARLFSELSPDAARIADAIEFVPVVSVQLSVDPTLTLTHPVEGFGFLVPREEQLDLLGALFMSRLFPGRAAPGRELITAMIGGRRWPGAVDAPEDDLQARIAKALDRALGLRGGIEPLAYTRHRQAICQPGVGHRPAIAKLRAALVGLPPLEVVGSWVDGVSVGDTLGAGRAAALRLMEAG
ncbi:MAG: protoporphyrinogen oxidase [Deltaproteobacteria bacterium]|nr:protoporphyrinogen oxidase [Deltaproteobacteria bacterium]